MLLETGGNAAPAERLDEGNEHGRPLARAHLPAKAGGWRLLAPHEPPSSRCSGTLHLTIGLSRCGMLNDLTLFPKLIRRHSSACDHLLAQELAPAARRSTGARA